MPSPSTTSHTKTGSTCDLLTPVLNVQAFYQNPVLCFLPWKRPPLVFVPGLRNFSASRLVCFQCVLNMAVTPDHNSQVLRAFHSVHEQAFILCLKEWLWLSLSGTWTRAFLRHRLAPLLRPRWPPHFSLQRVLWAPVHPHPTFRAGNQPRLVASRCQSVQSPRYVLLLFSDGTLYQGAGLTDRIPQGKQPSPTFRGLESMSRVLGNRCPRAWKGVREVNPSQKSRLTNLFSHTNLVL